ncbi:MAG: VirB4 family type IV secretion/conjugal transfer ATPase [Burkholderiaceae bacterium]
MSPESLLIAARDPRDAQHIPFHRQISSEVVLTREGDYLASWRLTGLPFEGMATAELEECMEALNLLMRSLSTGRFAVWVHRIRGTTGDRLQLPSEDFAQGLMEKYYARMDGEGLVDTLLYWTLVYRPYPQSGPRPRGRTGRSTEEVRALRQMALEALENAASQVSSTLREYRAKRLGTHRMNDREYSEQLGFYSFLINGRWSPVAVQDVPLGDYLPVTRKLFGNELIEFRGAKGSRFGSFLDLQDYADFTAPGTLNALLRLPCDFVETQSFSPMSRLDAASALKRRIRQLSSAEDDSPTQRLDMLKALDDLASGRFALGRYHYSLLVLDDSEVAVKAGRAGAADFLQQSGFRPAVVDVVPDAAFWAQLPGNWACRPRVAELSSRNFTGLASLHNFSRGKRSGNPWGEAITILRTPSAQPWYLNCHATALDRDALGEKALGSTQIIGQSGEGKTVLAGFIALNLSKYGADWVWFDKDRSAEILIRRLGGKYLTLERGRPTGFAPFKREPSEREILHWIDLIRMCSSDPEHPFTPREDREIDHAVRAVAHLPQSVRGFEAVLQNLPKSRDDHLWMRLARWSRERAGPLAWALDGNEDVVEIGGGIPHGFDYTELLEDASVHPQIMMNLIYRTEEKIDGRRFVYFMEEYWKALANPYFEDFAKNKQKTIRKQNGFGVFLTQSPSDTLANPIARTLIEQTATFIFLPNPSADRDDYVHGFKLTDAQYHLVKTLPRRSQLMLIKQGNEVAVARLDLSGFDEELMVLSGSSDNVQRLARLRTRLGEHPDLWKDAFLRGES